MQERQVRIDIQSNAISLHAHNGQSWARSEVESSILNLDHPCVVGRVTVTCPLGTYAVDFVFFCCVIFL